MKKVTMILALAGCTAIASAQPGTFLDLGIIGGEGVYAFDTTNSAEHTGAPIDTELVLWNDAGVLLIQNDDGANSANRWSDFSISLTAGDYYLGISEFFSTFEDNFLNTGPGFEPGEGGTLFLNIDNAFAGSVDSADFSLFDQETVFFKVTVVPAPSAMALLGLGGIVAGRRRR